MQNAWRHQRLTCFVNNMQYFVLFSSSFLLIILYFFLYVFCHTRVKCNGYRVNTIQHPMPYIMPFLAVPLSLQRQWIQTYFCHIQINHFISHSNINNTHNLSTLLYFCFDTLNNTFTVFSAWFNTNIKKRNLTRAFKNLAHHQWKASMVMHTSWCSSHS